RVARCALRVAAMLALALATSRRMHVPPWPRGAWAAAAIAARGALATSAIAARGALALALALATSIMGHPRFEPLWYEPHCLYRCQSVPGPPAILPRYNLTSPSDVNRAPTLFARAVVGS
ncbi:MAG: hypothetical protein KFH98_12160, partial [Gemmatimonadetes bacterium]|nr:hypothetical protein [Gemmatimonadota bacterium]